LPQFAQKIRYKYHRVPHRSIDGDGTPYRHRHRHVGPRRWRWRSIRNLYRHRSDRYRSYRQPPVAPLITKSGRHDAFRKLHIVSIKCHSMMLSLLGTLSILSPARCSTSWSISKARSGLVEALRAPSTKALCRDNDMPQLISDGRPALLKLQLVFATTTDL